MMNRNDKRLSLASSKPDTRDLILLEIETSGLKIDCENLLVAASSMLVL